MFCFTSAENDSDFCLEDEGAGDESSSCSFSESGKDSDFEASPPPKKGKGAKSEQKKMAKNKKTTEKTVKPAVAKGLFYSLLLSHVTACRLVLLKALVLYYIHIHTCRKE